MDIPANQGPKKIEPSHIVNTTPPPGNPQAINLRPGAMTEISPEALKKHQFTVGNIKNQAAGKPDQSGRMKNVFKKNHNRIVLG